MLLVFGIPKIETKRNHQEILRQYAGALRGCVGQRQIHQTYGGWLSRLGWGPSGHRLKGGLFEKGGLVGIFHVKVQLLSPSTA